ncbi:hypothetical protein QTP88_009190 [Uroleucon formosanum]
MYIISARLQEYCVRKKHQCQTFRDTHLIILKLLKHRILHSKKPALVYLYFKSSKDKGSLKIRFSENNYRRHYTFRHHHNCTYPDGRYQANYAYLLELCMKSETLTRSLYFSNVYNACILIHIRVHRGSRCLRGTCNILRFAIIINAIEEYIDLILVVPFWLTNNTIPYNWMSILFIQKKLQLSGALSECTFLGVSLQFISIFI